MGFEPATVDSRELYAPTERRVMKVDIYIHRTKAASYKRHATISKDSCLTKPGIEHLLFLGVGFEPATVGSREFCAPTEIRLVKVDTYIHGTKATTYKRHETISKYNRIPDLESNAYGWLQWESNQSMWGAMNFMLQRKEAR